MVAVQERRPPSATLAPLAEEAPEAALSRPARRDALPEHTQYVDNGCDLHPNCLTCPLVRCRYDEPGGARRLLSEERDRTILDLQRQRTPVGVIAQRFGVSRRTVFRVLARSRGGR
jgi:hypothetical protein